MPEVVTTASSFFEAEIEFAQPHLKIWLDRIAIVEDVYNSLRPWKISVDDLEVIQTGKPSDQGVKFRIPEKRASFFFGATACRFTRDNTSWDTAQETLTILDTALSAFRQHAGTETKAFKAAVALHVQPRTKRFIEILGPLIAAPIASLEPVHAQSMAMIVKWPSRRLTIDASAQIANGIFIRYERDFPAGTEYESMARQLYSDEVQVFAMLGIQEE